MERTKSGALVRLQGSDGESFIIKVSDLYCSRMIMEMIEDTGSFDLDAEIETLPVTVVKTQTLRKLVQWAQHHKDDPPFVQTQQHGNEPLPTNNITSWDMEFLKIDIDLVLELSTAADFFDIPALLDLCCKHLANSMKDKTPEEIREMYNLVNDLDPEEEKQILEENLFRNSVHPLYH